MPLWKPETIWKDEDVFIIGGGASLKNFDFNLLKSKHTIGCNTAFRLGVEICKICFFGDMKWFKKYKDELANYQGTVITNCLQLYNSKIPWLYYVKREAKGLHTDKIGWNGNSGASAINLALLLGAKTVYLLGFDMCLSGGRANWYENPFDKPNEAIYRLFLKRFKDVAKDLDVKFPDRQIINITKNSALDMFPKVDLDEFFELGKCYEENDIVDTNDFANDGM